MVWGPDPKEHGLSVYTPFHSVMYYGLSVSAALLVACVSALLLDYVYVIGPPHQVCSVSSHCHLCSITLPYCLQHHSTLLLAASLYPISCSITLLTTCASSLLDYVYLVPSPDLTCSIGTPTVQHHFPILPAALPYCCQHHLILLPAALPCCLQHHFALLPAASLYLIAYSIALPYCLQHRFVLLPAASLCSIAYSITLSYCLQHHFALLPVASTLLAASAGLPEGKSKTTMLPATAGRFVLLEGDRCLAFPAFSQRGLVSHREAFQPAASLPGRRLC